MDGLFKAKSQAVMAWPWWLPERTQLNSLYLFFVSQWAMHGPRQSVSLGSPTSPRQLSYKHMRVCRQPSHTNWCYSTTHTHYSSKKWHKVAHCQFLESIKESVYLEYMTMSKSVSISSDGILTKNCIKRRLEKDTCTSYSITARKGNTTAVDVTIERFYAQIGQDSLL